MPAVALSWLGAVVLAGVVLSNIGCAAQRSSDATLGIAQAAGLQTRYVNAGDYELLVARSSGASTQRLHVYIEGDGTPWSGAKVASNPGPFAPLAIRLMLLDPAPAALLGRPCYHPNPLNKEVSNCRPSLWSFERFSERVVASMALALQQLAADEPGMRLTLIGYSGGGVLATLLAHEVESVDRLVTVAAPLDVAAWGAHHRYTPLLGSLDPAGLPPLRDTVEQLHLQGANDKEVPPAITQYYFNSQNPTSESQSQPETQIRRVLDGQSHRCCWLKQWPQLLQEIGALDR